MAKKKSCQTPRQRGMLGETLRSYRKEKKLTQEELAFNLSIDVRTLRRYELGETQIENVTELVRYADMLGIPPERLGASSTIEIIKSPYDIDRVTDKVWEIIEAGRISQAREMITRLIRNIQTSNLGNTETILRSMAHAYHTAGYVVSEHIRASESEQSIPYYRKMEEIARELHDDTLLNIALTYQGDMFNRIGHYARACEFLEAARDTTPHADNAARGNGIQLLARVYVRQSRMQEYEYAMKQTEELAYSINHEQSSTRGHYSLGTVYEEWGKDYAKLGKMAKALAYLEKAEDALPKTIFWRLLVETARAIALVRGGEINAGIELAVQSTEQCYANGIIRYLDRMYYIDQFLESRTIQLNKARSTLREALIGGNFNNI